MEMYSKSEYYCYFKSQKFMYANCVTKNKTLFDVTSNVPRPLT